MRKGRCTHTNPEPDELDILLDKLQKEDPLFYEALVKGLNDNDWDSLVMEAIKEKLQEEGEA